jgi:hypothetical protein
VIALAIFQVAAMTLPKLMVLVIDDGVITKVFYPVFPPNESAAQVVPWLNHPSSPAGVPRTLSQCDLHSDRCSSFSRRLSASLEPRSLALLYQVRAVATLGGSDGPDVLSTMGS